MDGEKKNAVVLSILISLFLSGSVCFSSHLQHEQTFFPTSLPKPQTLSSWPTQLDYDPETVSGSNSNILSMDLLPAYILYSSASSDDLTAESLFNLRLQRDSLRVEALSAAANGSFSSHLVSGLQFGSGEYFARLGVGTPPTNVYMILDTGSDVVWLQCSPCKKCFNQSDPIFSPNNSTSFTSVDCGDRRCQKLDNYRCGGQGKTCLYNETYGDGSFASGKLSTETLTFGRTKLSNVALGCGDDNEGHFAGAAGLLGLGRGELSFPNQIPDRFTRKFSYCLKDLFSSSSSSKRSSILFGDSAVSRNTTFTPMVTNSVSYMSTFYYVGLEGISVGGDRVQISESVFKLQANGSGGVLIDSGTSVTRLATPAYNATRDAFRKASSNLTLLSEGVSLFDTCFDFSGMTAVTVPTVDLHFTNLNVSLPFSNFLVPVYIAGTYCFAFAAEEGFSIIGNIQQQGFRVAYDLEAERVGFAPDSC
ncbi:hypothetical protein OROHE_001005 [Orobanche hederae]